jgi:hypothetical protein
MFVSGTMGTEVGDAGSENADDKLLINNCL